VGGTVRPNPAQKVDKLMGIENVETKLHEARSFLDKMRERERMAFGDKAEFDHLLSAFLNAARTVDYRLRHECKKTYETWRGEWDRKNSSEASLIKSMVDQRNIEVHRSGSDRIERTKEIKVGVGSSYSDKSGTLSVFGSPGPLIGADTRAAISMPRYFFSMSGKDRYVTEVCAEYLTVLEQMVAQFKSDKQ
jgi:hypothetical protein